VFVLTIFRYISIGVAFWAFEDFWHGDCLLETLGFLLTFDFVFLSSLGLRSPVRIGDMIVKGGL
jgi:hypothetical protein